MPTQVLEINYYTILLHCIFILTQYIPVHMLVLGNKLLYHPTALYLFTYSVHISVHIGAGKQGTVQYSTSVLENKLVGTEQLVLQQKKKPLSKVRGKYLHLSVTRDSVQCTQRC